MIPFAPRPVHRTAALAAAILALAAIPGLAAAGAAKPAGERRAVTAHAADIDGRRLEYSAVAGTMTVAAPGGARRGAKTDGDKARGEIFYVAYRAKGLGAAARPVTFAFNGGPGAASAYLHLGALGPKRVVLNDDGTIPAPPARLAPNPHSWLAFTDLVFVDPVGTGFSRLISPGKTGLRAFWGVEQDARVMAEFIRLFLTRNDRWTSPKFLVGESYGGVRAATLAEMLQSDSFGIDLSGVVFVSPVLEYALTRPGDYNVLPWAVALPSYAASARYHNRAQGAKDGDADLRAALAKVEDFAIARYLPAITRGQDLGAGARAALYGELARITALPRDLIARYDGRIPFYVFARELLRAKGRIASVYDTSLTVQDLDPRAPFYNPDADPTLAGLAWPFTTAFSRYVRDELEFKTDTAYRLLNGAIIENWDWTTGIGSKQGFVTTAGGLKLALAINPTLKVFVAHGLYDLVTPYFATRFVIDQMRLPADLRRNITLRTYRAGHMIYTHRAARERLFADVKAFYRSILR